MLWHHMIVDGKLDRPIYETFGDKAYPIMTELVKRFPNYAWAIAFATLIGKSEANPARGKDEPIISVYIPGAPVWAPLECDHHAIKFHMTSGKIEWKLLWTPDMMTLPDQLPYCPVWVGVDYDEDYQAKGEIHTYYTHVNYAPLKKSPISSEYLIQDDDLFGFTYKINPDESLILKHIKLYVHPRWQYRDDDYIETNWDRINRFLDKDLPIDVSPIEDLEKTRGSIRFY